MATKVFMEALSPTMEEGRLAKWVRNEGDAVKNGDVLAEVETDKAIMELVARGEGILRKRVLAEGATAPVGALVGVIAGKDEDIAALIAGAGAAAPAPPAGPAAGTGASAPGPQSPAPPAAPAAGAGSSAPGPQSPAPAVAGGRALASPLARKMATDAGLSLGAVAGTGPGGRIIKRDIEAAAASGGAGRIAPTPRAVPAAAAGADYSDVALTQIRKTIARRLGESIGPIPTFYLTAEFDLERANEMRSAMAELGPEYKVSFNDIILKATATALAVHPEVNAHWLGDHIRYWSRVHLGMAVATDDGLIVPVIFDADKKGLAEISREAKALATRARERKLKPEEFTGSTFSVSNLGMMQIDQFTAIINPPEVGILAIGAIDDKPARGADGAVTFRKKLRVTMSCDHRAVDGAVGAKFLQTLRRMIENPLMLVY
ncbi:MAG TPA: dihydrolipoamide acetyltransferase family protein [Gemmatimonadaceae bacterium]|nr:dihydrolipoamide acetyltransferase family protein [Gemmatimonadaceae bacterium]